jgi:hypothetical protein
MRSMDSWFIQVSDSNKMKCLKELAHVKFIPPLNLKTTEETHKDFEKLKGKERDEVDIPYYYNVVEEVNEFNDWCISE